MKLGKAAGLDGLTTEHLHYCNSIPCVLSKLFNCMMAIGRVPTSFGQSYMHGADINKNLAIANRLRISCAHNMSWPWNWGWRSLNVIEIGANRKLRCGFLFAFCSNCGRICSRLSDIQCQKWRDFENQVRGRSRSFKMAPFDRQYATFYRSAIVNIALFCTIFELFTLNNIVTLKYGLEVTHDHRNWCHSKD